MRHRHWSAAVLLIGTLGLPACSAAGTPSTSVADESSAEASAPDQPTPDQPTADESTPDRSAAGDSTPAGSTSGTTSGSTGPKTTGSDPAKSTTRSKPKAKSDTGPRIVSFRVVQKPKCAEGTAVFRAAPVSLIIEWKIAGATGGALSVDDHTHTAGTYGQVGLSGREEFAFSCAGPTGTVERHTYAIYTVGGGTQKSKTLHVSAKVLDKGIGNG